MSKQNVENKITSTIPYIVFDGAEGVGKTTYLPKFKKYLEEKGYQVVTVREPGETTAGKIIRSAIFEKDLGVDKNLELFLADRILTQQLVIIPALREGKVVLSDRSLLSTCVYQGLMEDQLQKVLDAHSIFRDFLYPSIGLIAQLPFIEAMGRLSGRSEGNNWIDAKPPAYHQCLHLHFNNADKWSPFPVKFINFAIDEQAIHQASFEAIKHILPNIS